jgi:hypothetical protein
MYDHQNSSYDQFVSCGQLRPIRLNEKRTQLQCAKLLHELPRSLCSERNANDSTNNVTFLRWKGAQRDHWNLQPRAGAQEQEQLRTGMKGGGQAEGCGVRLG